jgi:kinetochore protein Mis13/DSN1
MLTLDVARAIQDQLLKDFGSRSEFSDWFSRDEEPKRPVVLKPNPRNIEHDAKIAELEARIERYVCSVSSRDDAY